MKNKILFSLLCAGLVLGLATGCGNKTNNENNNNNNIQNNGGTNHNNQENKKVPRLKHGTKKLRVATQIAAVRPLDSTVKGTTLRLSPGTPKADTCGAILPLTNRQLSETASRRITFIDIHMYLLYPYFYKLQEDYRTFEKNMLFPHSGNSMQIKS